MTYIARCCCKACEIEVDGEPTLNAVCNCASCKRRTGSAFGWSAYFRNEDIKRRQGAFSTYRVPGPPPTNRSFCTACGTTMIWESEGADQTGFAAGCFEATPLPEPAITAYDDRRCPWVGLPDSWMRYSPG
ncbi:MAG TPA: GFA family protein [Caulobacteraceae bacterium]|jgi:hypothetical protein